MDARKRAYARDPSCPAHRSLEYGSPPSRGRQSIPLGVLLPLTTAHCFRQQIEHVRQIDLDRARVDVEHAIAALDQPRPPLGTRLGRGRAFARGHNIDDQPQRERDEVGDVRPDRDLALDALSRKAAIVGESIPQQPLGVGRIAGKGIKRQVPIGTHITDFVSFPLRLVIDVVPAHEGTAAVKARPERRAWLSERGYRVLDVDARAIEVDLPRVLDQLAQAIRTLD